MEVPCLSNIVAERQMRQFYGVWYAAETTYAWQSSARVRVIDKYTFALVPTCNPQAATGGGPALLP